ncbi:MAG: hypothetical protein A2Y07_06795 [Planctomycetes bacterium GWF2_50_10]|nr:MAG: hypothetical protein A2Y07_06795 [Planctomycetes bacterium GWF2_50_10]
MRHETKTSARILAVDDNPTNLEILEELLSEKYDLKTAATGQVALELCADYVPDIVLLDVMMPGIDGFEVCRQIRANRALRFIKILMISAKGRITERIKGYEAGADDYIVKPFEEEELLAKLQVYLRLKSVQELDQIKSEFTMTVTHELRTPMTIVNNVLSNVLANVYGDINPRVQQELLTAQASITRLGSIVANFFDISRFEAGQMTLKNACFDIEPVIFKVVKVLSPKASARNIKINVHHIQKHLQIYADQEMVSKILKHLIENAVKFINVGGRIDVEVIDNVDEIQFEIKDDGPGIEPGSIEKIFDRFVQVQKHIGPGQHGTGLGLSIVKKLIEMHDGRIWVESVVGKGSKFCFTLPKAIQIPDTTNNSEKMATLIENA